MNIWQVRYYSEMIGGSALWENFFDPVKAHKEAARLRALFMKGGFIREAKSVQVC